MNIVKPFRRDVISKRDLADMGRTRLAMLGTIKRTEFYGWDTNLTDQRAFAYTSSVKEQSLLRGRSIAIFMRHRS